MRLSRKFSDFLRLEEAEGNLPRLAGMGVAVASSFAVTLLAPAIASAGACIHGDYHADTPAHSETTVNCYPPLPDEIQICRTTHSDVPHSDSWVGCY